jgi:hypothetical protein
MYLSNHPKTEVPRKVRKYAKKIKQMWHQNQVGVHLDKIHLSSKHPELSTKTYNFKTSVTAHLLDKEDAGKWQYPNTIEADYCILHGTRTHIRYMNRELQKGNKSEKFAI